MAYIVIPDSVFETGKRLFASTMRQLRDNIPRIEKSVDISVTLPELGFLDIGNADAVHVSTFAISGLPNGAIPISAAIVSYNTTGFNLVATITATIIGNQLRVSIFGDTGAPGPSTASVVVRVFWGRGGALT